MVKYSHMKRATFIVRFGLVSVLVASGFGILSSQKAEAVGSDGICRVALTLDRSGSVEKNIGNIRAQVRALFGPTTLGDKTQLAFWVFSGTGNGSLRSKDGNWPGDDYNSPLHGYVSSKSLPNSFRKRLDAIKTGEWTNFAWAFGYNHPRDTSIYTPNPDLGSMPSTADIVILVSDGTPTKPYDKAQLGKNLWAGIYAKRKLAQAAAARGIETSFMGVHIQGDDTNKKVLSQVINEGNGYDYTDKYGTNILSVSQNYKDLASKLRPRINSVCAQKRSYDLTPSISLSHSRANPSQSIEVQGSVRKTGSRNSDPTEWSITRIAYPPNTPGITLSGANSTPIAGNSTQHPCARLATRNLNKPGADIKCQNSNNNPVRTDWRGGIGSRFNSSNTSILRPDTMPSEIGSIVCYFLSLRPPSSTSASNAWAHSRLQCSMVAKSPTIRVTGGDVRAIGAAAPPITGTINVNLGSWVEYGVFSTGPNQSNRLGSGGSNGARLTFANTTTPSGNWQSTQSAQPSSSLAIIGTVNSLSGFGEGGCSSPLTLGAGSLKYDCSSNVTINASAGITGQHIISAPSSTVTINGNIDYSDNCGGAGCTIARLPQVIIIADTIRIQPNVTNIDAWLITTGSTNMITTCNGANGNTPANSSSVNTTNCGNTLRINGPIITKVLHLYRAGSSNIAQINDPVEIFHLRPDAYLWLHSRLNGTSAFRTTSITELPPRY